MTALDIAALVGDTATGLVFGGMVVFSFVVAPAAFKALGRDRAGDFLRVAFPAYYRAMAVTSVLAAVAFAVAGRTEEWALAGVGVAFVALLYGLLPAIEEARDGRAAGNARAETRFKRLHALSVVVNMIQLAVVFAATIGLL